jgi:pimeloyl-ACP methyl ester carboxylesterase
VVFVHGAGGNRLLWGSQVRSLAAAQRAVAVDLPGHGRSDGPGLPTIGGYAEVMAEVLDHLGSAAVVVGHSMGGGIALRLALDWPELVAGLVLLGTGGRLRVAPALLAGLQADFPQAVEAITGMAFAPGTGAAIRLRGKRALLAAGKDALQGDFQACDTFDVLPRLGEIHVTCLVICGAEDRMTPPRYSDALVRGIPGARLEIMLLAGHMAMLEQPGAVSQSILNFVSGL